MANENLALAIPTYNRPEILLQNLRAMLPELREHGIPIYISDDSTTDETRSAIELLRGEYPHLHYTRNQPGLGHDRNCLATLALPDAKYVWYLGDAMIILPGVLTAILAITEEDYDFIFLNSRVKGAGHLTALSGSEITGFFERHAWHLTMTGATIYGPKFRQWMRGHIEPRIYRNFQQLGLILEYVYATPSTFARAYWFNRKTLTHNNRKQSYWMNSVLQVFALDWVTLVDAFAEAMGSRTCEAIIRSHDRHTRVLSFKRLAELRSRDLLNPSTLQQYGPCLARAGGVPNAVLRLLAHAPRGFVGALLAIERQIHNLPRRLFRR